MSRTTSRGHFLIPLTAEPRPRFRSCGWPGHSPRDVASGRCRGQACEHVKVTDAGSSAAQHEVAYYYPEPFWRLDEIDGVKTLLLFFDEIATLLPRYMHGRDMAADPVLASPLFERGLLRRLEPETFVDQQMTEELSTILVQLITDGAFDGLDQNVYYQELSQSRLGWDSDVSLATMVIGELQARGLAKPSQDRVSVPLHPTVRSTVLILLSQLARTAGQRQGLSLHPVTSHLAPIQRLMAALGKEQLPSAGHVVALDLQTVCVDLASVPLDEILDFRDEHGASYRAYSRDLRRILIELSLLPGNERQQLLLDREEALQDTAADLRRAARGAWRLPFVTFALGAAGAAWEITQHDPLGAALVLGGGIAGAVGAMASGTSSAGAYSYLFQAQHRFSTS
jgi:hypothetical protein